MTTFLSNQTGGELCLLKNMSQSEDLQFGTFVIFLFVLYPPARVFLWVATAHRACLPLYEANGPL